MKVDIVVMNTVGITHRVRVGIAHTLGVQLLLPYRITVCKHTL
jgi:deoxyinosine 3'endonuclease (endonuclease V)